MQPQEAGITVKNEPEQQRDGGVSISLDDNCLSQGAEVEFTGKALEEVCEMVGDNATHDGLMKENVNM